MHVSVRACVFDDSTLLLQLPKFEKYIRPQDEFYITVIRLFGIKTATVIVILLSLRAKIYQVRQEK